MRETAFIRTTSQSYDQVCDVAHVPLTETGGDTVVAYLGTVNGEHRPSSCVTWKWLHIDDVWDWVASKGYQRKEDSPSP
jgi:hypothetical protein